MIQSRLAPRPRDAARGESCPRVCPLASPHNHHCSEPVPGCTPCCDRRRASGSLRGSRRIWHNRIAVGALLSARPRVAFIPTAPPRPPKQARAVLIPFYASDARAPPLRPRRSKTTWARRACRGFLGAGPQAACAASRCGPLEPPFLSIPPLKDALKAERSSTGGPERDVGTRSAAIRAGN